MSPLQTVAETLASPPARALEATAAPPSQAVTDILAVPTTHGLEAPIAPLLQNVTNAKNPTRVALQEAEGVHGTSDQRSSSVVRPHLALTSCQQVSLLADARNDSNRIDGRCHCNICIGN